jgi:PKD repeat protein
MKREKTGTVFSIPPLLGLLFFSLLAVSIASLSSAEGTVVVDLGDDLQVQEDAAISFISWVSYTGTKGLTYEWDFGDGTVSYAQAPTKTYTKADDYTVSLTVTDSDGITDSDSITVSVLNVRPIAKAGSDRTTYEGTTVTFDGSDSWDTASDLPLLTYEWDFGDGTMTEASYENKIVTHTYADAGVYITRLVVRDDDWQESNYAYMASQMITVSGASTGNGTISFFYDLGDAPGNSTSDNSSGSFPYSFYWDFGDGSYATGNSASHTFTEDGLYVVTLILTDAFGAMSVHNIIVTVLNHPPTADAGPDHSVSEDETITFHGHGSDPGGGLLSFEWDFGDGHSATTALAPHAYTKQGTYTATLTVTDADGLTDTDTCSVTVSNVQPVAGLTSNHTTEEGDIIGFYGTTSYDTPSDLPLLTYSWDFGDGGTGTGVEVSHAYGDEGTYTVTLTVTDDDDAVDTITMTLAVDNADPVASIDSVTCSADPILPDDVVSFSGSGTDAGTADTLSYGWSFGDGSTASGTSATHSYTSSGTYTVTLTVTDNDGGTGTATTTVVVETLSEAAEEAQDIVDEAPTTAFDKPQSQALISEKFDDLLEAIAGEDSNKIDAKIHVLEVQINNKVDDEDLKAQLLEILDNIEDSLG